MQGTREIIDILNAGTVFGAEAGAALGTKSVVPAGVDGVRLDPAFNVSISTTLQLSVAALRTVPVDKTGSGVTSVVVADTSAHLKALLTSTTSENATARGNLTESVITALQVTNNGGVLKLQLTAAELVAYATNLGTRTIGNTVINVVDSFANINTQVTSANAAVWAKAAKIYITDTFDTLNASIPVGTVSVANAATIRKWQSGEPTGNSRSGGQDHRRGHGHDGHDQMADRRCHYQ